MYQNESLQMFSTWLQPFKLCLESTFSDMLIDWVVGFLPITCFFTCSQHVFFLFKEIDFTNVELFALFWDYKSSPPNERYQIDGTAIFPDGSEKPWSYMARESSVKIKYRLFDVEFRAKLSWNIVIDSFLTAICNASAAQIFFSNRIWY